MSERQLGQPGCGSLIKIILRWSIVDLTGFMAMSVGMLNLIDDDPIFGLKIGSNIVAVLIIAVGLPISWAAHRGMTRSFANFAHLRQQDSPEE